MCIFWILNIIMILVLGKKDVCQSNTTDFVVYVLEQ